MFGIINVVSVFLGKISKSIIGGQYNYKVKQKAKNKMHDTYIDYDGKIRSVKTNKIVYRERLYNGDYVLKDDKLNIIRNYTKEKLNNRYNNYINDNVIITVKLNDIGYVNNSCSGYRLLDLKTNNIYVERKINNIDNKSKNYLDLKLDFKYNMIFYMDINTGLFIRPSDYELNMNNAYKHINSNYISDEKYKIVIEKFNLLQKEKDRDIHDKNGFIESLYYINSCDNGKPVEPNCFNYYVQNAKAIRGI